MIFIKKRAENLARMIVEKSTGTVRYEVALEYSMNYYKRKSFLSDMISHVGDDRVSYEMSKRLAYK